MLSRLCSNRDSSLTLLELQSRFGYTQLKFRVICPQLSPKRDRSPKRVNIDLIVNRNYSRGEQYYLFTLEYIPYVSHTLFSSCMDAYLNCCPVYIVPFVSSLMA